MILTHTGEEEERRVGEDSWEEIGGLGRGGGEEGWKDERRRGGVQDSCTPPLLLSSFQPSSPPPLPRGRGIKEEREEGRRGSGVLTPETSRYTKIGELALVFWGEDVTEEERRIGRS